MPELEQAREPELRDEPEVVAMSEAVDRVAAAAAWTAEREVFWSAWSASARSTASQAAFDLSVSLPLNWRSVSFQKFNYIRFYIHVNANIAIIFDAIETTSHSLFPFEKNSPILFSSAAAALSLARRNSAPRAAARPIGRRGQPTE